MDLRDLGTHRDTLLRVQVGERLVHQKDADLSDEGAADGNTLSLAARKSSGKTVKIVCQAQDRGGMINLLFDDIFIDALKRQAKCNIVKDRHLRIQSVTLEYHRHLSLSRAPLVGSVPVDQEIAVGNVLKACDHSKRRGFTASGRSDENDKLALLNIKIEIVNGVVSIRIDLVDVLQR